MKVKSILLTLIVMLGLGGCSDKNYTKVPFSVPVDFSKKGTVYETEFQAPWNIWGSEVGFEMGFKIPRNLSDEQRKIKSFLNCYMTINNPQYKGMISKNQYFKLKVTLTPLGWASHNITIWTMDMTLNENITWRDKLRKVTIKEYTKGQKIEEIVSIPLYGWKSRKDFMVADLQRLRNYHIKVESLEDVEIPDWVVIHFRIGRHSRKV